MLLEVLLLLIGMGIGIVLGRTYFAVTPTTAAPTDIGSLSGDIREIKTKFLEIDRQREEKDKLLRRIEEEKEKRLVEWMKSTNEMFKEINAKSAKSDEEKEKRIKEYMDHTKKFFEEQKLGTQQYLAMQSKAREELELKRDAQLKDMRGMIQQFTETITGTKRRGNVGENFLKEALSNSIRAGVVKTNLKTSNGVVEFAWNLDDTKYIPIDSKLPEVFDLLEQFEADEDSDNRRTIKKKIQDKVKLHIKEVVKYQNTHNTIDSCLLVLPEGVLGMVPEVVEMGKDSRVYICSYRELFPITKMIEQQYHKLKEEGDVGKYKQTVQTLIPVLSKIEKSSDTIDRALTQIQNANSSIKDEVASGRRSA